VVAAGNDNSDACGYTPAFIASAVTVGSTTYSDSRSPFSNFGPCLDIFAPGSQITSAWSTGDTDKHTISGTSMACPHVSGAVALLLSKNPNMKPREVTKELLQHASLDSVHDHKAGSPNKLLFVGNAADTPAPAPGPPPSHCASKGWMVVLGDECEIDDDCCLTSKVYSGEYAKEATCIVQVGSAPGEIEPIKFQTEAGYDKLEIPTNGATYTFSGSESPRLRPKANSVITWSSDYSVQDAGFKLCMKTVDQNDNDDIAPTITTTTTTTTASDNDADGTCSPAYGQCGGNHWNGPTCCQTGCRCHHQNEWHSQCEPPDGNHMCQELVVLAEQFHEGPLELMGRASSANLMLGCVVMTFVLGVSLAAAKLVKMHRQQCSHDTEADEAKNLLFTGKYPEESEQSI